MTNIAIVLVVISLVGLASLGVYYFILKRKYSSSAILQQKDSLVVKNKVNFKDTFDKLYQILYMTYVKMPLIKYFAKKVRLKYEMTNDYSEYELRRNTGRLMTLTIIVVVVALAVFVNVVNDLYMILIILIGLIIVVEKVVDITITSVSNKILRQMPEAFTILRHAFHEHGMVDEAISDVIDEMSEKEIAPQLKRIREAIISDTPEVELERYYDTAPNRFLKLFAGISYLTYELGDRRIEDTSIYLKNLNNILNEIYLEILKQDKLKATFRSLTVIAVAPLIFVKPIESWAVNNFAALANFYNSSIGFVMQSLIIISIFMSYILLRVLREDGEEIKFDRVSKVKWQERLYRINFVRILVDAFKTKQHTSKYKKEVNLIKDTNSYLTIEWLYVNKLTYAFAGFLLTMLLMAAPVAFGADCEYSCVAPYDTSSKVSSFFSTISGSKLIKTKISEKIVKKSIAKTVKGGDLKVDIDSYSAKDLNNGIFKSGTITGKNVNVDGIYLSSLELKTLCYFNYIQYDKKGNLTFKEDLPLSFKLGMSADDINNTMKSSRYQKIINDVNKLGFAGISVSSTKASIRSNKFYYDIYISIPFMKDIKLELTADVKVKNGAIDFENTRFTSNSLKLDLKKIDFLMQYLNPLDFSVNIFDNKDAKVYIKNIAIKNNIIVTDGVVIVPKD